MLEFEPGDETSFPYAGTVRRSRLYSCSSAPPAIAPHQRLAINAPVASNFICTCSIPPPGGPCLGRSSGCGCQPSKINITMNPSTYAATTNHPPRIHATTERASGKMLEMATPADDPNQIIEPPKPTAYARPLQS